MPHFADVIVPVAVPGVFTYALPEGVDVVPGMRIVVPFGSGRKLYAAMVLRTHQQHPDQRAVRKALSSLDRRPVISPQQLELWQRMADHYLCGLGEVMLTAMPGPLVLTSNTRITATDLTAEHSARTPRLALLLAALEKQPAITLAEAGDLLQVQDPLRVVKELLEQGAIGLEEELRQKYRPRVEVRVAL
nr:primosomal protein N' [Flavobacteriales bacterium]